LIFFEAGGFAQSTQKYHDTYNISSDQRTLPGRVALTHGNGGEPDGVAKAKVVLETWKTSTHPHHHLISLEKAISCAVPTQAPAESDQSTAKTKKVPTSK
jgi:hypothetical protein